MKRGTAGKSDSRTEHRRGRSDAGGGARSQPTRAPWRSPSRRDRWSWQVRPPRARRARAGGRVLGRAAIAHIRDAQPPSRRRSGRERHDRARRDLLARPSRGAGLERLRAAAPASSTPTRPYSPTVDNVLGSPAGTLRSLAAVVLVAHYDSVAVARGGRRRSASRSCSRWPPRPRATGPRPRRADPVHRRRGQACLSACRAFFQAPSARRVGLVLNFDNPGSRAVVMYRRAPATRPRGGLADAPVAVRQLADRRAWRAAAASRATSPRCANAGLPGMTFGLHRGVRPQPLHARHGRARRPRQLPAPRVSSLSV